MNFEKTSQDFLNLNKTSLQKLGIKIPEPVSIAPNEPIQKLTFTKADVKREKELQRLCRNALTSRHYIELTNSNAADYAGQDIAGWFGHLSKPQGNAFMPDLFVFNPTQTRCLMVELKVHNAFQVGQKEMITAGTWRMVTTYDDFITTLKEWEQRNE